MYVIGSEPLLAMYENPTRDDIVVFMTRGLSSAVEEAERLSSVTCVADIYGMREKPLVEYLMLNALINVYGRRCRSYHGLGGALREVKIQLQRFFKSGATTGERKAVPAGEPNQYEQSTIEFIDTILSAIPEKTTAAESVITSCAPIVPYVTPALKKPFPAEIEASEDTVIFQQGVEQLRDQAFQELMLAFSNPRFLAHLLSHRDMFTTIEGADNLIPIIKMNQEIKGKLENLIAYYSWAWIYQNADTLSGSDACTLIETVQHIDTTPFVDALDAFERHLPAEESALLQQLDAYDKLAKFVSAPAIGKVAAAENHPTFDQFDLNELLNYIYTSRRYRANNYTNSSFARSVHVGGYLFYKDLLFIQPKGDPNDQGDQFIYCPVLDDLQGSKPVIIRYWANGNIDVMSERQFWNMITPADVGTDTVEEPTDPTE